jgi:hypothetical protein
LAIKEEVIHQQTIDMLKKLEDEEKNPNKDDDEMISKNK